MTRKNIFIFGIVISNILFLLSLYYMFYYKEASFDTLKKPEINSVVINSIETDEGTWRWGSKEYDFYNDYKVKLVRKTEIQEFCNVIKESKAKYVDNLKCKNWVNIYFDSNNNLEHKITLKYNFSEEIFFEYDNHTYEGEKLESFLKAKIYKIK